MSGQIYLPDEGGKTQKLWQDAVYMLTLVLFLVFAAFAEPALDERLSGIPYDDPDPLLGGRGTGALPPLQLSRGGLLERARESIRRSHLRGTAQKIVD